MGAFIQALNRQDTLSARARLFFKKFHYGFNFLEQIMLMTVPHAVAPLGDGVFLVNLWSYVGYLEVDCRTKTARSLRGCGQGEAEVLGSRQRLDRASREIHSMVYSLPESMAKMRDPFHAVPCRILKGDRKSVARLEIWSGPLTDCLHDIMVNATGEYCVVCELGIFQDDGHNVIPSKVLIIDMKRGRHRVISKFIVAVHAQFDPKDADVIYFANHNFQFVSSSMATLMRRAICWLTFLGPASVHKCRLMADGPREIGVFTEPDMFRMTDFHVFMCRGRKLLAAMGYPNFIFLADADTMRFIRKIAVQDRGSARVSWERSPYRVTGSAFVFRQRDRFR